MNITRALGATAAIASLAAAVLLYNAHPVRSSDHQDSPTVLARPAADITDVFVFPSPTNSNNVVFVMNVDPLIPAGLGTARFFDPAVMYQFKIAHGAFGTTAPEDLVIQIGANGVDANQTLTVYGPATPAQTGTTSTFVAPASTFRYNETRGTKLANGILAFAGPRADPFFFDLFQFFKIIPDRNYSNPRTGDTLGTATPTFNGFASGTVSGTGTGAYACSTAASQNALTDINGGFNVLAIVLEIPKTLIAPASGSQLIHVWATTSTTTGS
jgi:hypothetical protein